MKSKARLLVSAVAVSALATSLIGAPSALAGTRLAAQNWTSSEDLVVFRSHGFAYADGDDESVTWSPSNPPMDFMRSTRGTRVHTTQAVGTGENRTLTHRFTELVAGNTVEYVQANIVGSSEEVHLAANGYIRFLRNDTNDTAQLTYTPWVGEQTTWTYVTQQDAPDLIFDTDNDGVLYSAIEGDSWVLQYRSFADGITQNLNVLEVAPGNYAEYLDAEFSDSHVTWVTGTFGSGSEIESGTVGFRSRLANDTWVKAIPATEDAKVIVSGNVVAYAPTDVGPITVFDAATPPDVESEVEGAHLGFIARFQAAPGGALVFAAGTKGLPFLVTPTDPEGSAWSPLPTPADYLVSTDAPLNTGTTGLMKTPVTWSVDSQFPNGLSASTYDVRWRRVSVVGNERVYSPQVDWITESTATGAELIGKQGRTYQLSSRVRDSVGRVGPWGPWVTTHTPLDDRGMSVANGFVRKESSNYWDGTYSRASGDGAAAATRSPMSGFTVMAATCSTCGSLMVYVDGVKKATVSTYSATTAFLQEVYTLPTTKGTHTVRVVADVTKSRPRVYLDAIVLKQR